MVVSTLVLWGLCFFFCLVNKNELLSGFRMLNKKAGVLKHSRLS